MSSAARRRSLSALPVAGAVAMDVDPLTAARRLLGAVVTARGVSARIVEVEAYGGPADGPADAV
jgi:DNA-3-methyladenine glycosylase